MVRSWFKTAGAAAAVACATFLCLAVLIYHFQYQSLIDVYFDWGRSILQVDCGQATQDQRLYALKPGRCRFRNAEFSTVVHGDADGYRNQAGLGGSGPLKLAVLGDSHAMGWGVAEHQKLAGLLAADPRFQVRDLAMSSYGTPRELFSLTSFYGEADIVVLQYCDNDLEENLAFVASPATFAQAADAHRADFLRWRAEYRRATPVRRLMRPIFRGFVWALVSTWRILRLPPKPVGPPHGAHPDLAREAEAFAGVLALRQDDLAHKHVVVFESNGWGNLRRDFAPAFRRALDARGIGNVTVLDLSATLRREDFHYIDDHPTAAGHRKTAGQVLLTLNALIPTLPANPARK